MTQRVAPLLLVFLLALPGVSTAQPVPTGQAVPMQQVRGAGNDRPPSQPARSGSGSTISTPATQELSVRTFIVEWIVCAGLTVLAVFAVGRTSWRG